MTMMARIEAGERLASINDAAIAAGNMRQEAADQLIRRLEDAARETRRRAARATPAVLAAMGIGTVNPEPSAPAEKAPSDV